MGENNNVNNKFNMQLYKEPVMISFMQGKRKYHDGAIFVIDRTKSSIQNSRFGVLALIEGMPATTKAEIKKAYMELCPEAAPDLIDIRVIQPAVREKIDNEGREIYSVENFNSRIRLIVDEDYFEYKCSFGEEVASELNVIYYQSSGGGVIFYGTTLDPIDEKTCCERFGRMVSVKTYAELLEKGNSNDDNKLLRQIKEWLKETSYNDFCDAITSVVIGQPETENVLICVYNYLENISMGKPHNSNVLLAAPSGCGKTETFRALKRYFADKIPALTVAQVDMTQITEQGFKGGDTRDMLLPILKDGNGGIGLLFLDEFDKKLIPSYSNGMNVNAAVQAQILTVVEGREFEDEKLKVTIDTSKTMFIGLGSYDSLRTQKEENCAKSMGFFSSDKEEVGHYDAITRADMIELGASFELIGRFAMVVNYYELGNEAFERVVDKLAKKCSEEIGMEICVGKDMRSFLKEKLSSQFGCRSFESTLKEALLPAYSRFLREGGKKQGTRAIIEAENQVVFKKEADNFDGSLENLDAVS